MTPPLRIIHLANAPVPSTRASAVQCMHMAAAFASHGAEVSLFVSRGEADVEDPFACHGVPRTFSLHRAPRPSLRKLGPALYLMAAARRARRLPPPDLVFSRDAGLALLVVEDEPFIFEAHDLPHGETALLEARLLKRPSLIGVVTTNEALREAYLDRMPFLDPGRVIVAHNGAVAGHEPTNIEANAEQSLRVGYIGSLRPEKGVGTLLDIARRCPELCFELVGAGERELVASFGGAADLPNVFCHGPLSPERATAFAREMDILVVPSRGTTDSGGRSRGRFPSPIKLFEYMAAGRPIVASDLATCHEVLEDEATALLVPPGDTDAWVSALRRLGDVSLRRRLGAAARAALVERHTVERRAALILGLFERSRRSAA